MDSHKPPTPKLRVAVVGCGHGQLDTIYADLESRCLGKGWTLSDIDLLIICGDFQALRNESDLECMSVPRRYRRLGDFHKYYSGQTKAPVLTLVIGGNHEASNYLYELHHGGWLAPNIYYLGAAGVVRLGPWRIAGLSGIYHKSDYRAPHHERLPYDRDGVRTVYHVREREVEKLLAIGGSVDIGLSHDWPAWVELCGDYGGLYAARPHFLASAKIGNLGSPPASRLLGQLRPSWWFSGHMHVRFAATVQHTGSTFENTVRALPVSHSIRDSLPIFKGNLASTAAAPQQTTEFLGLSKVGDTQSEYMEILELDAPKYPGEEGVCTSRGEDGRYALCYDEEWLAITRAYNDTLRLADPSTLVVPPAKKKGSVPPAAIARHRDWVRDNITHKGLLGIPDNFVAHAPTQSTFEADGEEPREYPNQQTADFAALLQMENKFEISVDEMDEDGGGIEFGWD